MGSRGLNEANTCRKYVLISKQLPFEYFYQSFTMNQNKSSLSIGLLENCYHSLKRGYELWNIVKERNDKNDRNADDGWLLKESIILVHHGRELALKKMLAEVNECYIFEKLDDEKFGRALGKYKK